MSVAAVVAEIFPNGKRIGRDWCVGSIRGEPGESLKICLTGNKAGMWIDYAEKGSQGGLIGLVMKYYHLSYNDATAWLHDRGCPCNSVTGAVSREVNPRQVRRTFQPPVPVTDEEEDKRKKDALEYAWEIAKATAPIDGTSTCFYLQKRGYSGPVGPFIRHGKAVKHTPTRMSYPCMVGVMTDSADIKTFTGVHRTYLDPATASKADIVNNRMILGNLKGSVVRLSDKENPKVLGVCEGIETGLCIQEMTQVPFWAALSANNLINVQIPPHIEEVIIACDNDEAGLKAGILASGIYRSKRRGLRVRMIRPQEPFLNDFNEVQRRRIYRQDMILVE